jgi:hypothetical protein
MNRASGRWVWDLEVTQRQVEGAGFDIGRAEECSYISRYMDAGALAYYLKAVSWDAPDFDVDRYTERMLALHWHIEANGGFDTTVHQSS